MKNAALMREMDGAAYFHQQCGRVLIGGPLLGVADSSGQRAALHKLHAEEMMAVRLAHVVNRDDVRMIQLSGCFGFRAEALHLGLARELAAEDHLQGHNSVQACLAGSINDAHPPMGNFLEQLVIVETPQAGIPGNSSGRGSLGGTGCGIVFRMKQGRLQQTARADSTGSKSPQLRAALWAVARSGARLSLFCHFNKH